MKTKLTFLVIAIAALLGVGMLMAFKQEEKTINDDKVVKYLSVNIAYSGFNKYEITKIDENNVLTTEVLKRGSAANNQTVNDLIVENEILNQLAASGYKLVGNKNNSFYFIKG